MTWLTWRLQRAELALLALVLLGLGGLLLQTHGDVVTYFDTSGCVDPSDCDSTPGLLFRIVNRTLPWFNMLPLLAALLLALPIVTELENGTYRLAWTQSITRGRWARAKLGVLALCGLVFAALFAITFAWWSAPIDRVNGRLGHETYDLHGVLPIGHTLFAIGLMLAIGAVLRRPLPAIGLAAIAFVAVRVPFAVAIRPDLVSPRTERIDAQDVPFEIGDWLLSWFWRDGAGKRLSEEQFVALCRPTLNENVDVVDACIAQHGLVRYVAYHPASHYWPLQLVETGIFLAAAAALIGFAAWYMLRRVE